MIKSEKKMNKGALGLLVLLIVLGILLLIEYFVVSYFVRFEFIVGRFMSEVPILSEADKVETYVRSFQNAVELSLLQGIYDIKDQSQVLWYDYGSNMPDEPTIKNKINEKSKTRVEEYLSDYYSFIQNNNVKDIKFDNPLNRPNLITAQNIIFDDSFVSIRFNEITFTGTKDSLEVTRNFNPSGRVRTQFKAVWDLTNALIMSDEIGNKTREKISTVINTKDLCTVENVKSNVNTVLNQFQTDFNAIYADNKKIEIVPTLDNDPEASSIINPDDSFNHCQFTITVKIIMEDKTHKYPVYDGSKIIEDYLGLIYKIRTGN